MLKEYLSENHFSIYRLAKTSGVPYSTVNDLVNSKLAVENLRSGQLRALAEVLSLSMDELYDLCAYSDRVISAQYEVCGKICVKHKSYYLTFERDGKKYEAEIVPVRTEATRYIRTLALWKLEEELERIYLEEAYEAVHSEAAGSADCSH